MSWVGGRDLKSRLAQRQGGAALLVLAMHEQHRTCPLPASCSANPPPACLALPPLPLCSNSPGGVNFESAPFKLTRELLEVMDSNSEGKTSELFDYFKVGGLGWWVGGCAWMGGCLCWGEAGRLPVSVCVPPAVDADDPRPPCANQSSCTKTALRLLCPAVPAVLCRC